MSFGIREEKGKTVLMKGEFHNLLSKGKFYTNDVDFIYVHSYVEKTQSIKENNEISKNKLLIPVGYQITLSDKFTLIDLKLANFFTRQVSFREITKEEFIDLINKAQVNFNERLEEFKNIIKEL